jgi:Trypsin
MAFVANVSAGEGCSGTVIAPMVVLTAAHCAIDLTASTAYPPSAFRVVTGSLDWTQTATRQVLAVASVDVDPAFSPSSLGEDAALLVLSSPTQSPALTLATAGDAQLFAAGTPVTTAGWGYTYVGESTPPTALYWGASTVQSQVLCENDEFLDGVPFDSSDAICALDTPSMAIATCHGDSGGPLVAIDSTGEPVEIGVTSRGDPSCNPDYPSVFTRADTISAWVNSVVDANPPPAAQPAPAVVVVVTPPASAVTAQTGKQPIKSPVAPTPGLYRARTAQRGGRVAVSVVAGAPASDRVTLRFRLSCWGHGRVFSASTTIAPLTAASGAWRFSARGGGAHRWRYAITGLFRSPASIEGTFSVTMTRGRRCTTGRLAWNAKAA